MLQYPAIYSVPEINYLKKMSPGMRGFVFLFGDVFVIFNETLVIYVDMCFFEYLIMEVEMSKKYMPLWCKAHFEVNSAKN